MNCRKFNTGLPNGSQVRPDWLKKLVAGCGILSILFIVLNIVGVKGFWNEKFGNTSRNDKYVISKLSKEYPFLDFRIEGTDILQAGPALFQNHDVLKYRTYYLEPKSGVEGFFYAEKYMVENMEKPNYAYSDLIFPKRTDPVLSEKSFLLLLRQLSFDKPRSEYFYKSYWLNYKYSGGSNKWSRNSGLKFGSYNGDNLVIVETIVPEKLSGTTWATASYGKTHYYLYNIVSGSEVKLLAGDFDYNKLKYDMSYYENLRQSLENKSGYDGFNLDSWLVDNNK